ncbi:MAG: DUF547 domain-containing protein [Bacteriovoracaceae bacterium]|nr:DUF547 domain-containing protein [Bacteriovoracaceae bacterium]
MKSIIVLFTLFSFNVWSSDNHFDHEHAKLEKILNVHLKSEGAQTLFNYKKVKEAPLELNSYLEDLSSVSKSKYQSFSKDQRLAFLINAYNAFTLKLIVDNYPVKSIKDLGGLFSSPWKKKFFKLFGEDFWLDRIEHDIIRKKFKEARIHFAVNCASLGCPSLYPHAFTAGQLETQLEESSKIFLRDQDENKIDISKKTVYLSKIFKWYGGDFEKQHKSVENFISKYFDVDESIKSQIATKKYSIKYLDYNWKLNEWK